jgi:hypothetical protein
MKFKIADLLLTTTAAAILFTLLRFGSGWFGVIFLGLNLLQILIPFGVVFATIVFAQQRGPMLDVSTLAGSQSLKKLWCLSIVCTLLVWAMLFYVIFGPRLV